jgi:decaprenyl-phosphate phosphoribosyltransferase
MTPLVPRAALAVNPAAGPCATGVAADIGKLIKLRYHVTFLNVVFGTLIFATELTPRLIAELGLLYLSFNVLLYGGIYTMNDVADRLADARHPVKRHRPVAAGRIAAGTATGIAAVLVSLGIASGALLFGPAVMACYALVLGVNVAYSGWGRDVPVVELVLNSAPHAVRFLMGVLLVGRMPPATHLLTLFLLAIALSALRRQIEREAPGWETRRTLGRYGRRHLAAIIAAATMMLLALASSHFRTAPGFYGVVVAVSIVLVGGARAFPAVRQQLARVWVR